MTIYIAALCEGGIIFVAADRMKTAGDIQFEPHTLKIFGVSTSIVIMTAGDASFQRDIFNDVYNTVIERIKKDSKNWWRVKDVTELYVRFYNLARLKRAESAILAPIGLDHDSFITRQSEMSQVFVNSITKKMLHFEVPTVSAIITGVDTEGAHIYVVNDDVFSCWDTIGFASIGIGSRHAGSHFMYARHSPSSPLPEALLLTYYAKKWAEVAPGVGKETDMFMIGPQLGTLTEIVHEVKNKLEKEYQQIIKKEEKIHAEARKEVNRCVEEIQKTAIEKQQET